MLKRLNTIVVKRVVKTLKDTWILATIVVKRAEKRGLNEVH